MDSTSDRAFCGVQLIDWCNAVYDRSMPGSGLLWISVPDLLLVEETLHDSIQNYCSFTFVK